MESDRRLLKIDDARRLRRDSTPPERILWSRLRDRRLGGIKFRRQQPIGPFVADFYCPDARLVVELDGQVHGDHRARDARRNRWMEEEGLQVLRVSVSVFMKNQDGVLREILHRARGRIKKTQKKR